MHAAEAIAAWAGMVAGRHDATGFARAVQAQGGKGAIDSVQKSCRGDCAKRSGEEKWVGAFGECV